MTTENTATPVIGKDGKIIPGLFAFDFLERDLVSEVEIAKFEIEQEHQKKLQELENSQTK